MAHLKGRDKQVELKRKHLVKPGAGQNEKEALLGELGDDIVGNIERKLSMLNQLWLAVFLEYILFPFHNRFA